MVDTPRYDIRVVKMVGDFEAVRSSVAIDCNLMGEIGYRLVSTERIDNESGGTAVLLMFELSR